MPTTVFNDSILYFLPTQQLENQQYHQQLNNNLATGNGSSTGSSSSDAGSIAGSYHEESSNSPLSRSPDTTTGEEITGSPYLSILEEPHNKFRFRYKTEMQGAHGAILGTNSQSLQSKTKSFPTVKLCNYKRYPNDVNDPIIRCTIVTGDPSKRVAHVHRLIRKSDEGEQDDPHDISVRAPNYTATFSNMTILYTKKEEQEVVLLEKKKNQMVKNMVDTKILQNFKLNTVSSVQLKEIVRNELSDMNLNVACLKFEALINKGDGKYVALCEPVFSKLINNMKNAQTNDLRICKVDRCMGTCKGGDIVFIFTEKIVKTNIKVKFVELHNDKTVWSAYAEFKPEDVHHQYGIVFRTPPYRDATLTENVVVHFLLERPSDGAWSEPRRFEYTPDINYLRRLTKKRPRYDYNTTQSIKDECGLNSSLVDTFHQPRPAPEHCGLPVVPQVTSSTTLPVVPQEPSSTTDLFDMEIVPENYLDDFSNPLDIDIGDLLEILEGPEQSLPSSQWSTTEFDELLTNLNSTPVKNLLVSVRDTGRSDEILKHFDASTSDIEMMNKIANTSDLVSDGPTTSPLTSAMEVNSANGIHNTASYQMDASAVELGKEYLTKPVSGASPEASQEYLSDPYRGTKKATPMQILSDRLQSTSLNDTSLQKSVLKKQPIVSQMEVEEASKNKVPVTKDNIVKKTDDTLNKLQRLHRAKRLTDEKFRVALQRVFKCRVEKTRDSVLHILAAKEAVEPALTRFLNLLKLYSCIESVINSKNIKEETPLLVAAQYGCGGIMSLLLETGANPNELDADRNTAAHHVAGRKDSDTGAMSTIMKSNIDLTKCNDDGLTALHIAVKAKKCDLIRCIGAKESADTKLLINQQDLNFGNTALHFAVQYRSIKLVNTLLDTFGAKLDVNLANYDRTVPLAYVLRRTDPDSKVITDKLISYKADPGLVEKAVFYDDSYKTEEQKDEININDADYDEVLKDNDEEVDDNQSAYARQWEDNQLFDKATVEKLCPILDKHKDWMDLAKNLGFSETVIKKCRNHWSPSLFLFQYMSEHRRDMLPETVRDELFAMPDRLLCCAQFIDDMLLRNLSVK